MDLCAVALVKQDLENELFHIFYLENRNECSLTLCQKAGPSRLEICAIATKWRRFSESVKRRYSFTISICLSITCPVNRSIATCTQ
jgi:hypothetical protein